jgi:predicted ester cyclase
MSDENKAIARRAIEELYGEGRLETADELIAAGAISHDPALPEPSRGPEGVKEAAAGYRGGFPDLVFRIEDQCAEGDLVCTRWTAVGTNSGEFWGMAPTGKQATVSGITIDRITGDKIVESWTNWDALGLMQQLGVVPMATPA